MGDTLQRAVKKSAPNEPGLIAGGCGAQLAGAASYYRRGLDEKLPPEAVSGEGVFWSGRMLGERGLDVIIDLAPGCFVDRVLLHQQVESQRRPSESVAAIQATDQTPTGQDIEAAELQVTTGVGSALAFTRARPGAPLMAAAKQVALNQGVLPGATVLEIGAEASELVLSLDSYRRDVRITRIEVWGGGADEPRIYPQPRLFQPLSDEPFTLSADTAIAVRPGDGDAVAVAADVLRDTLAASTGLSLPTVTAAAGNPAIELSLAGSEMPPESYRLRVAVDGVTVAGADRPGLIYGVHALAQLAAVEHGSITPCVVEDQPKMIIRGVHLYMPSRDNVPFFKRLIRHLLAPMRYNTIFLEVGAAMAFDRHPEINEAWVQAKARADRGENPGSPHIQVGGGSYLSKAEVRDLVEYAEAHGIEVIPEIQSLSHVEFLTMAHPEIAESAQSGRMDCYCPQNERSYEILFDAIDEIVEVFRPRRYVHMGHDEAYSMCLCERCRDVPKAELFARDVNRIYEYLRGKGLGMMIWDDMVHTTRDFACPEALDMIPKDIVLLNFVWYDRTDIDTEVRLLAAGFPVMIGNFYSSHFPRFAEREGKPGLVGAEVSTWYTASEEDYGRLGKLYDFIYSANMMWSDHYDDRLRWLYDRRITALLPGVRDALSGTVYPSGRQGAAYCPLPLATAAEPLRDPRGTMGGYDLSGLPQGDSVLGGVPFSIGDAVTLVATPRLRDGGGIREARLAVDGGCESVVFLHTCTQPGAPSPYDGRAQPVATYTYVYADGTRADVAVEYGWQLAEWNRRHAAPLRHPHWRHSGYIATYPALPFWQGKTAHGEDVTLYGYEWINPHPDRKVAALLVTVPEDAGDAALILVAATAVTRG